MQKIFNSQGANLQVKQGVHRGRKETPTSEVTSDEVKALLDENHLEMA